MTLSTNSDLGRLLTAKQVAQILNCSERKAYKMITDGFFHCVQEGPRFIRVWDWSVKDYLRRKTQVFCYENALDLHNVHDLPDGFDQDDEPGENE
jgi:predicted DNA-binding transcriptional regulator AlpA